MNQHRTKDLRHISHEYSPNFAQRMIAMIKKFILFFLRIIRRALCCFSRKRCDSNSQHEALQVVNVVNDSPSYKKSNAVNFSTSKVWWHKNNWIVFKLERDWNSWDDKPRTIEEHIEVYRENLVKVKEPEPVAEVENIDLFEVCVKKELINQTTDIRWTFLAEYGAENCETEESLS